MVSPVNTAAVAVPTHRGGRSPAPLFDDSIEGVRLIENQTLYLGCIIVLPGGQLTLRNVHRITGGTSRCSDIRVDTGATLIIEGCTISHMEYGYGFQLQPTDGSTMQIKDTTLSVCGHERPYCHTVNLFSPLLPEF